VRSRPRKEKKKADRLEEHQRERIIGERFPQNDADTFASFVFGLRRLIKNDNDHFFLAT